MKLKVNILNLSIFMVKIMPLIIPAFTLAQTSHVGPPQIVNIHEKPHRIIADRFSFTIFFKKTLFGKLRYDISKLLPGDSLFVELAEKSRDGTVDSDPGGSVRYTSDTLIISKDQPKYVYFPQKKDTRNSTGRAIKVPDTIGIIMPFNIARMTVSGKGEIAAKSATRISYHYRFNDKASSFISSDTILNRVWDLCKHTIKATSFTGLYIDGDRERIPYEADALINQLSHYAVDREYTPARNTIEYLMQNPSWPTEWHLQMHQMVWYDMMYTGNLELVKKYYHQLKDKTLIELAGANGLISTTVAAQSVSFLSKIKFSTFDDKNTLRDITDWPQIGNKLAPSSYKGETDGFVFCPYNSVVNAFYYRSLLLMVEFAKIMNEPADQDFFSERAAMARSEFRKVFTDPVTGLVRDGDTTSHISLHANMFALCFGLIEENEKEKITSFIRSRGMACSVYGAQFLLDALFDAHQASYAISLMNSTTERSWYNMIRTGSSMTLEAWDRIFKPNLDWNHAWGTAPLNIITRKLIGIEPKNPAGHIISIQPNLGDLKWVKAKVPMVKGLCIFKMTSSVQKTRLSIKIPGGTKGMFAIPAPPNMKRAWINGKKYWSGEDPNMITSEFMGSNRIIIKKRRNGDH